MVMVRTRGRPEAFQGVSISALLADGGILERLEPIMNLPTIPTFTAAGVFH